MKWRKLGRIFDPAAQPLPLGCQGFAQAPHTLVLEDRVRIYFSTRISDRPKMMLSQIAFVDFDRSLQRVLILSKQPVLELGALGCFDEHGIFPLQALHHKNGQVMAYYTGLSRRVSVSLDAAIGLATSDDQGLTFTRYGPGPVMAATLNEPFLIADGYVLWLGNEFHMWYIFGTDWVPSSESTLLERVYKLAHASSADGINWKRDGRQIVPDRLQATECQAMPTVFYYLGRYHMYFCYRQAHGFRNEGQNSYRLGYAFSNDLLHWTRDDSQAGIDVSPEGWDSQMQCYPHVFTVNEKVYMLYNGNEFGRHGFGLARLES